MYPASSLQVILAFQPSNFQDALSPPGSITTFIRNDAATPVTILTWNTPLDSKAGVLGVFEIRNSEDSQIIPIDKVKLSRKLPATRQDLVEIEAGQTINQTVKLPVFNFEAGHEYDIQAQGVWHALWEKPLTEVTESHLLDFSEATRGEYWSNIVRVKFD
ncbi:hypothetical protein N7468_007770 [Penicillium chermesinum]|uniref:Uncharacterized protein n=1 Tax=Penicillium chermesinum TaxID=63820 RepID=A0A9W9NNX6_9EURO|nr:uncharacterized protein N7468_007770 [Penicillium chermesinum]KAJ5223228.1 hypothetical protein N7468_007770 [Penicillium chermesinum]